jgi:ornithine cyclodeaminase/alanine dehydrogenase-like protein (mu-crystallin family)
VRMHVLTDEAVARLSPWTVVAAAREALLQFGGGRLTAPPRVRSQLPGIDYVFTVGALADGATGFRCYRAGEPAGDQLTAVWDPAGQLIGVVVGNELGARRTGGLGAVAADVLSRADAQHVAVIGSGTQAWTQLWALTAVRRLRRLRVYSPTEHRRNAFAVRVREELEISAEAVDSPSVALREADIVILATRSTKPVIDVGDVPVGAHLTTVGPKFAHAHEMPSDLLAEAAIVTCDSPDQAAAYPEPFFTAPQRLTSLADVLLGRTPGRRQAQDITVHCSVGLAGSEIVLAERLLEPIH